MDVFTALVFKSWSLTHERDRLIRIADDNAESILSGFSQVYHESDLNRWERKIDQLNVRIVRINRAIRKLESRMQCQLSR